MNNWAVRQKFERMKTDPFDLTPSKENMYLWGLLWADGYILEPKRLALEILSSDFCEIEHLLPHQFKKYVRTRKDRTKSVSCGFCSREDYISFLLENGYRDKVRPSNLILNSKFLNYWVLGLIDGDGCWYKGDNARQFAIAAHYGQNWDFLSEVLNDLDVKFSISQRENKKGEKWSIVRTCNIRSLKLIHNFIYPNGFEIGFKRKYLKSLECIS